MKYLKIVLPKLNETDIDVWSDKVHSYYTYSPHVETELKPVIVSVRGYSLRSAKHQTSGVDESDDTANNDEPKPKKAKNFRPSWSGPSPEKLLAHANALINKVTNYVTKLVDAKYGGKKPTVSSGDKSNLNVEMSNISNDASWPVETPANPKTVRGNQDKQAHTIRCKICIESFGSIKEYNVLWHLWHALIYTVFDSMVGKP